MGLLGSAVLWEEGVGKGEVEQLNYSVFATETSVHITGNCSGVTLQEPFKEAGLCTPTCSDIREMLFPGRGTILGKVVPFG